MAMIMMDRSALTGAADTAWRNLQNALSTQEPLCAGDDRFIQDNLSPRDTAAVRTICAGCPLLTACSAFADLVPDRHSSGYWAGRRRGSGRGDYAKREKAA